MSRDSRCCMNRLIYKQNKLRGGYSHLALSMLWQERGLYSLYARSHQSKLPVHTSSGSSYAMARASLAEQAAAKKHWLNPKFTGSLYLKTRPDESQTLHPNRTCEKDFKSTQSPLGLHKQLRECLRTPCEAGTQVEFRYPTSWLGGCAALTPRESMCRSVDILKLLNAASIEVCALTGRFGRPAAAKSVFDSDRYSALHKCVVDLIASACQHGEAEVLPRCREC